MDKNNRAKSSFERPFSRVKSRMAAHWNVLLYPVAHTDDLRESLQRISTIIPLFGQDLGVAAYFPARQGA
jgi:hypothetical protein